MKKFFLLTLLLTFTCLATARPMKDFVTITDGRLTLNEQPYYFVGTNLWYAPILASKGQGGDRKRLEKELDRLAELGLTNLRILVGADAGSDSVMSVRPYLQSRPHELNDTLLDGLDYLLKQMDKRHMKGVFYLTNSWDWSGGYGFYLKNTGHGDSPNASGNGYSRYTRYASKFYNDKKAQQLYFDFVQQILSRKNRYTQRAYIDEPAIMAWQICNEPRPFAASTKEPFLDFIEAAAKLIKRLDPNHLVSTGSEGYIGCESDQELCTRMNNNPDIDYITLHIWPCAWGWATASTLFEDLPNTYLEAGQYIDWHVRLGEKSNKPLVIEEFGYPRDYNSYKPQMTTNCRDGFYSFVLERVTKSCQEGGNIAGCNFWGWAGSAVPESKKWAPGQPFICDPPHEPQGWYSVFDTDQSTLNILQQSIAKLKP